MRARLTSAFVFVALLLFAVVVAVIAYWVLRWVVG